MHILSQQLLLKYILEHIVQFMSFTNVYNHVTNTIQI